MAWHKDKEIKADISIFRSLFPEQTKTPTRIVIWSIVLFVDVIICVFGAFYLGIISSDHFSKWMMILILVAAILLLWIQGVIYGAIAKRFKRN